MPGWREGQLSIQTPNTPQSPHTGQSCVLSVCKHTHTRLYEDLKKLRWCGQAGAGAGWAGVQCGRARRAAQAAGPGSSGAPVAGATHVTLRVTGEILPAIE